MLLGILSDSHGRVDPVREAAALFKSLGVGHVVHCGDVGGIDVFEQLIEFPLSFVWGNCDEPDAGTSAFLATAGVSTPQSLPVERAWDGVSVGVCHGHEREFQSALRDAAFTYLFHGHTHEQRDERVRGMRVINPGALHRTARRTVATLDTSTDRLDFHEIGARR